MSKYLMLLALTVCLVSPLVAKAHGGDEHTNVFSQKTSSDLANREVELTKEGIEGIGIELITAKKSSLKKFIKSTGQVEPAYNNYYDLSAPVSGLVNRVFAKEGDPVYKGQVLASINSLEATSLLRDLLNQKANLEKEIAIQTADLELKKQNFEREEALLKDGITSRKDFLSAQTAYSNNQAALEATKKQLSLNLSAAKSQLSVMGISDSTIDSSLESGEINSTVSIIAPMNGVVSFRDLSLGENIQANKRVFSVVNLSPIWILMDVYQEQIPFIKLGQEVNIISASGEKIKGSLSNIGATIDAETRTLSARITSKNSNSTLKPGMTVNAEIIYGDSERKAIIISETALIKNENDFLVFVKEVVKKKNSHGHEHPHSHSEESEDHFILKPVKTGNSFDQNVEILEGLDEGDEVVIHGAEQLKAQLILSKADDHSSHKHGNHKKKGLFDNLSFIFLLGATLSFALLFGFWFFVYRKKKVK